MKVQITPKCSVSNYSKPYIIAEIGANHNGDMELAKKIIDAAVDCGCDAVKFQSWTPESLISAEEYDRNQTYDDSPKKHFGSLKEMVTRYYLRPEQHHELNEYCKEKQIDFCSSPFSNSEIDLLIELDVPFLKIASMDINNTALLKYAGKTMKSIIISTGMSTISEIEKAVETVFEEGNTNVVLLHCISIYPPDDDGIHLRNISMLQQKFDIPVGFSDHSFGVAIPLASIALGACVIEKHFTLDKSLPGWDHEISADPQEMKLICDGSKRISEAMGNYERTVSAEEEEKKKRFRRSIVLTKKLQKGSLITESDLAFKRPGTGIAPNEYGSLLGKTLNVDVEKDTLLQWRFFEL